MNNMECAACGCISLALIRTDNNIETWTCGACGHTECHVAKRDAFDVFIHEFGMDAIDGLGKVEAMKAAFLAGRTFEMKSYVNEFKTRPQAE